MQKKFFKRIRVGENASLGLRLEYFCFIDLKSRSSFLGFSHPKLEKFGKYFQAKMRISPKINANLGVGQNSVAYLAVSAPWDNRDLTTLKTKCVPESTQRLLKENICTFAKTNVVAGCRQNRR
jgi:hypothetical protein